MISKVCSISSIQKDKADSELITFKVVFKDLQKLVVHSQREENTCKELFQRLHNKPFWIWNIEEHKQEETGGRQYCCC
jgi:hypothetical protein